MIWYINKKNSQGKRNRKESNHSCKWNPCILGKANRLLTNAHHQWTTCQLMPCVQCCIRATCGHKTPRSPGRDKRNTGEELIDWQRQTEVGRGKRGGDTENERKIWRDQRKYERENGSERRQFSFLQDERQSMWKVSSTVMLNARSGLTRLRPENGGKYDSRDIQLSDWRKRSSVRAGRPEILG